MSKNEFERSIAFWKAREAEEKAMMLRSRKAWKKLEREMKKWEEQYSAASPSVDKTKTADQIWGKVKK